MREIVLTRSFVAIVDDADYPTLSRFKWWAGTDRKTGLVYAIRHVAGTHRKVKMHRQIMGLRPGDPREVDHVEPEATLDNRRSNLRISTKFQNSWNRGKNCNNTSGFKGVSWHRRTKKWGANISANGQRTFLGYFDSPEPAAEAYRAASLRLHGDFSIFARRPAA